MIASLEDYNNNYYYFSSEIIEISKAFVTATIIIIIIVLTVKIGSVMFKCFFYTRQTLGLGKRNVVATI